MESIFEDDYLLVVNKPTGFIVEGPTKDGKESLTTALQAQRTKTVQPCHRLDRDTTGVLVFAKDKSVLRHVFEQFAKRRVRKTYLACVDGIWNPAWNKVETKISRDSGPKMINCSDGKEAITTFRRLAQWKNRSLLEALPKTGRTHQIRLHCLHHECPVSGDSLYGQRTDEHPPMALHARKLQFLHPRTKEPLELTAPLPDYWENYWLKDCPYVIR